jgi:transcriptional regulator with XRE-family HTH domain
MIFRMSSAGPATLESKAFGNRVREIRQVMGLTQQQLADRMSCHQPQIAALEAGEARPGMKMVERLAIALDAIIEIFPSVGHDALRPVRFSIRRRDRDEESGVMWGEQDLYTAAKALLRQGHTNVSVVDVLSFLAGAPYASPPPASHVNDLPFASACNGIEALAARGLLQVRGSGSKMQIVALGGSG